MPSTPSLGEYAAQIEVRPLLDTESLLVGALHRQVLSGQGITPPPGPPSHVSAFARAWQQRSADLPAWVAQYGGQHVGLALCQVPMLPLVGPGEPELLVLAPLHGHDPNYGSGLESQRWAEAICLAMVRTIVTWFGRQGYLAVRVASQVRLPAAVLNAARADVLAGRRISLPTRP